MTRCLTFVALLGLSFLCTPLAADEPSRAPVGVYGLDRKDHAAQIAASWREQLEKRVDAVPKKQADAIRASFLDNARTVARGTYVFLDLREDRTFHLSWARQMGGPRNASLVASGAWAQDGEMIVLEVAKRDTKDATPWFAEGVHRAELAEGAIRLPARDQRPDLTFLLQVLPEGVASLVRGSSAERTVRVRQGLAKPGDASAFSFTGAMILVGLGGVAEVGTMRISAAPTVFEGKPAWKVTEVLAPDDPEHGRKEVAWLARDLTVLRHESTEEASEGGPGEDPVPAKCRVVIRTPEGYRVTSSTGDVTADPVDLEVSVSPVATVGGQILFLRACPDLPLTYEIPLLEDGAISARKIEVRGHAPVPFMPQRREAPMGWQAEADGLGVVLSTQDRRPLLLIGRGTYGGVLIAAPDFLSIYDLMEMSVPARTPRHAASAFALATLRGDPTALEQLLDFDALRAYAKALGYDAGETDFRRELLAKLDRRRKALLPGEIQELRRMVSRVKSAEGEGSAVRVRLHPPCEDFEVLVSVGPEVCRIIEVLPCIYAETLCCGDTWTDPDRAEPVVDDCRLWLHRRNLRNPFREYAQRAAGALGRMGVVGIPILMRELFLEPDDRGLTYAVPQALATIGLPVLPALLEAYEKADEAGRARLDAVAEDMHMSSERGTPDPDEAIPVLLAALDAEWPTIRPYAIRALEQIGPSAAEAIPTLEALLPRADKREKSALERALRSLRRREVRIPIASCPPRPEFRPEFRPRWSTGSFSVDLYRDVADKRRTAHMRDHARSETVIRAVGTFEPGSYVVVVSSPRFPPVVLRDVELTSRVTTLDPIDVAAGCSLTLRLRPRDGVETRSASAEVTWRGAPSYRRRGSSSKEAPNRIVIRGLGTGTFRLTVRVGRKRERWVDKEIELDGVTDVELDV